MGKFDEIGQGGFDPVGGQGYCVDIAMLLMQLAVCPRSLMR